MISRATIAAALVLGILTAAGCGDDEVVNNIPRGRTVLRGVQVGDTLRSYRLFIPAGTDTMAADIPLLIVFHGWGDNGTEMQALASFDANADAFDFFVAYPDGMEQTWAHGAGWNAADSAAVNDTGFVRMLIQDVDDSYSIDRNRVYAAGYSAGGLFAYRLACELDDEIAAIASVAAPMSVPLSITCSPSLPVAILGIQGTDDDVIPFEGDTVNYLGATETIQMWANWISCPDSAEIIRPPDNFDDGTFVVVERYRPCASGAEATAIGVLGGTHAWQMSAEFNTSLTISAFFLEHER
jgi:polyhydroxybutyrate depolymerase